MPTCVQEFLENCLELESCLALVYQTLTQKENLNRETLALFLGLERNGNRFAERLRKDWGRFETDAGALPVDPPTSADLLRQLEKVLNLLAGGEVNDLRALRLMKRLETVFWNFYLKNALYFDQLQLKTLLTDIAWEKRNHISLLQEHFLDAAGTANWHR